MSLLLRTLSPNLVYPLGAIVAFWCHSAVVHPVSAGEFKPIKEAELPADFPTYTPVGQIEVKQYPAHRKASASGAGEFWKLFRHIKQNNVKMTAPVEMDYGDPHDGAFQKGSMSFFYEKPDQGSAGEQGGVEVIDVPAMQVVCIGCRGLRTVRAVNDAREKLMEYLSENKVRYRVAGPMRVMGYNSPFVPPDQNFYEVQIPVRSARPD